MSKLEKSHPRKWVDYSDPTYLPEAEQMLWEFHPREWVDCSGPTYNKQALRNRESHQRQSVDCSDPALHRKTLPPYPPAMYLTPFTSLAWAYQLHYYICFRTHRRRPLFSSKAAQLIELVSEICARHDYHLLECRPYPIKSVALLACNRRSRSQRCCRALRRTRRENVANSLI
jgi:hypothetical protein